MIRKSAQALLLFYVFMTAPKTFASPQRVITDLGNGIYRFQNDTHFSIFIVGKQSVLLTDPINADAAKWLRAQIKSRFGPLPVKYVIYSHNHGDHVFGGEVFREENTTVVAQEKAAEDLKRNQAPTALPNLTFADTLCLDFEGRKIHLAYHGPNNGTGSISLFVPDAKFLFVVDWIVLKRFPWREMYYYDLDGMIASIREVMKLDFKRVAPGHSVVGTKNDVAEFLGYLEDLRSEVLKGMNEKKSLKDLQDQIPNLPRFKKYLHYASVEDFPLNIKGAYEQLSRTSGRFGQDK